MDYEKIENIAKKYGLRLLVLFGSRAVGTHHEKSDFDIAYISVGELSFPDRLQLIISLEDLFKTERIDLVNLSTANILFRYEIMQRGKLLYGDESLYSSCRRLAFRDFLDSRSLLRLESLLIKKRQKMLADVGAEL